MKLGVGKVAILGVEERLKLEGHVHKFELVGQGLIEKAGIGA